jgi:hypothetical protein
VPALRSGSTLIARGVPVHDVHKLLGAVRLPAFNVHDHRLGRDLWPVPQPHVVVIPPNSRRTWPRLGGGAAGQRGRCTATAVRDWVGSTAASHLVGVRVI